MSWQKCAPPCHPPERPVGLAPAYTRLGRALDLVCTSITSRTVWRESLRITLDIGTPRNGWLCDIRWRSEHQALSGPWPGLKASDTMPLHEL
jgi:hypothetical protein